MIKIALCDDEPIFKKIIEELLVKVSIKFNEDYNFSYFSSSRELLEAPFDYDILFLDIKLEEKEDGITIGKQLREKGNTAVFILVTSMQDRYREGYQAGVLRYLEKPIIPEEFDEALSCALKQIRTMPRKIEIKFKTCRDIVKIEDILYIESYNRKRYVHTETAKYPTLETLDSFFKRLPDGQFYYPQKCCLINFAHVVATSNTALKMSDGKTIAYIKGRYQGFNQAFTKYLGGKSCG
ncbi:MAG: LytTR family DNA-binding domain-containing protein [Christensenellaceae bacterium]